MIEEVWKIVLDDIVYLPLYHPAVVWAMREDLELPADPMNQLRFRQARFK